MEEKSTKKVIGHVIFHEYNEPLEYEIGWIMNRKFQRKGYVKEASLALFEYGFHVLKLKRIIAETTWVNKQSIAAIESLGMKLDDSYEEKIPVWVYNANFRYI